MQTLLDRCLALDLELRGGRLAELAGRLGSRVERELDAIDALAAGASFLVGHNLLEHDLPWLRERHPRLRLLELPVVDTLWLSPLAFPGNPYHRLVKDYKLVRDSLPDPAEDCRLCLALLRDAAEALRRPEGLALSSLLRRSLRGVAGFDGFLEALGIPADLEWRPGARACATAWASVPPPEPTLAFVAAWLSVAGGGSVIPAWVRKRFPDVAGCLGLLRETPCSEPGCLYCREAHDPAAGLRRFFGLPGFRGPQSPIVEAGLAGRPLLALLPTGGGKSICYQLPALARHWRRGSLTLVVSPLQALMKDQVDNLAARTGTPAAAALFGMLTPPERADVLERVRLGDVALLYVAPEQLRNPSLRGALLSREIGAWVFDEAHCLSKWGHDFRPDYLYAGRFIRELAASQGVPPPPVQCFTATAKPDVKEEILDFFKSELGQRLQVFESSVERENLRLRIESVPRPARIERIHELLLETIKVNGSAEGASPLPGAGGARLAGVGASEGEGRGAAPSPRQGLAPLDPVGFLGGCAIVYLATRKACEAYAEALSRRGWPVAAFHAGLEPPVKKAVQEAFLSGELRVVCATNAFGMGIDKEDVRLVVHERLPGSLEAYLQEAGRAGRDGRPADCVLFYDQDDAETQFRLQARSELSRKDIEALRRALYRQRTDAQGRVVVTVGELLMDEAASEADLERGDDTKVKAAIAWLERAGFVERDENQNRVFQGRPKIRAMSEAERRFDELNLSSTARDRWQAVLACLFDTKPDAPISADRLAGLGVMRPRPDEALSPTQLVLRTLQDLAEAGLLEKTLLLTAYLRHKVKDSAPQVLERLDRLEEALLEALEAEGLPEAGEEAVLSLRRLNQRLLDQGQPSEPRALRGILRSLAQDGRAFGGQRALLELRHGGQDDYRVRLLREWPELLATSRKRRKAARAVLRSILGRVPREAAASASLFVEFALEDLLAGLASLVSPGAALAASERSLLYLHEGRVLQLQQGLAVFRQAMTLRLLEGRARRYTNADFEPLRRHYEERRRQVHAMDEYARLGVADMPAARRLLRDYFELPRQAFQRRYFRGRAEELGRATTAASWSRIVEGLSEAQKRIVLLGEEESALVLAGPGSGKTRVVAHRCAYLLRVLRVPAASLLVLCFNRAAATELRRRLDSLIGEDARGVAVHTYHGLALRLTGASLQDRRDAVDFDEILRRAIRLLRGETELPGLEPDELRERLLAGYRFILVDEYQDIDPAQYDLISAIAGRTDEDPERKLAILAVGDDDQTVYGWRGANVEFIRRFQRDYTAQIFSLLDNYRSGAAIVETANGWIEKNLDRMKRGERLRAVEREKAGLLPAPARGSRPWTPWELGEKVLLIEAEDAAGRACAALERIDVLRGEAGFAWTDCAVLARTHEQLAPLRALCELRGISVSVGLPRDRSVPLARLREVDLFLGSLREARGLELRASELERRLVGLGVHVEGHPWWTLLRELVAAWRLESFDAQRPVGEFLDFAYEALASSRREPRLGGGLFLGTLHSAKGLEFEHVLLLVDAPRAGLDENGIEEERRLIYVGMTRARRTLAILHRRDRPHPEIRGLEGPHLERLAWAGAAPPGILARGYEVLGLDELFLSYAGQRPASDRIHARLARLAPGSPLWAVRQEQGIHLVTQEGPVAHLSKAGAERWAKMLDSIEKIRVLGVLVREAAAQTPEFRERLKVSRWEVPWVEVVLGEPKRPSR